MKEFNFDVDIYYPKETDKELYKKLKNQCVKYGCNIIDELSLNDENFIDKKGTNKYNYENYDLIIDSIFGFSFKGDIRPPFDEIIKVRIY